LYGLKRPCLKKHISTVLDPAKEIPLNIEALAQAGS
jgi:hypothetical protein